MISHYWREVQDFFIPWYLGENAMTLWPWGHLWSRVRWIPGMQLSWSYCHETNKPWSKLHTMNISKKRVWIHLNPTLIIWLPIVETPILSWLVVLTILKDMNSSMGRMTSHIWNGKKKCLKPPTSFQGICRSRRFRVPPTRAQRQRRAGRGVGGEVLELLGQSLRLADTLLTHRYTQIYVYIYIIYIYYIYIYTYCVCIMICQQMHIYICTYNCIYIY